MTDTRDAPASWRDGAQLLLRDLTCICGTLSEITTVWRRARPYLPGLPASLPGQLQDTARQLAAGIRALTDDGPGQPSHQASSVAARFCALKQSIASAQAMTRGPGRPEIGDGRLWESLRAPLQRAAAQLTVLVPQPVLASG